MSKDSAWIAYEAERLMMYFADQDISMTEALGIIALTLVTMWEVNEEDCTKENFDSFVASAQEGLDKYREGKS